MAKRRHKREDEEAEIRGRTAPPGSVVYHAVYREGQHELNRNLTELALSGLAAGLSMGFSLVAEGLLSSHLPDVSWRPLLTKLGYSLGFLVVILGRQQLFTKNTLTVMLPLLHQKSLALLGKLVRLWIIVLLANLAGAFAFAWFVADSNAFNDAMRNAFLDIGRAAIHVGWGTLLVRGIVAGWLIALMVWLLPFAESARIWVIIILAYVIGIAELPHVIAGSAEAFFVVTTGELSLWKCLSGYVSPVLIGNVIGGVALVAVGAHAEFIEAGDEQ